MDRGNGMPAGMLSSGMTAAGGFLGLDMSLQQYHPSHHQHQRGQQQQLLHQPPHPQPHMIPFQTPPPGSDGDRQSQHPMRHGSYVLPFGALGGAGAGKQQPAMSSEEDSGFADIELDVDARRGVVPQGMPSSFSQQSAPSPWQRMKWTDGMVRLLITVVYHVGDDVGGGADGEQQQQPPPHGPGAKGKKAGAASALLQKKGKWKSVSQAMMEKGFSVSPQQCEDKFNDLNKRYKRVNDLLGKGTACRVVENQALLDTMDHLSSKAKEEARKLLNSKHLFFPEMCRYHNAGLSSCNSQPPPLAPQPANSEQQQCLHHPGAGQMEAVGIKVAGRGVAGGDGGGMLEDEGIMAEEDDEDDDVDSEDEDDYDDDDDEDDDDLDDHNRAHHRQRHHQNRQGEGEEDEDSKLGLGGAPAKRPRRTPSQQQLLLSSASASPPLSLSLSSANFTSMQQLKSELLTVAAGGGEQQQRQWLRRRSAEMEELRVGYQSRALQLERQRFKWFRYSSSKEREMEQMKLDNERLRLENDRMLLLLRQKEIELNAGSRASGAAEQQQQQLHYSAAHSGRPTPDDQPSGTATA